MSASELQGSEIANLYEAKVLISDQSSRAQRQARITAFREVLVKVSGSRSILRENELRAEINKASNYLLSYRYESEQDSLFYIAEFDRQRVDKLVRVNNFPLWGARRPETLIWFAWQPQNSLERQLLSESSHVDWVTSAKQVASGRGIAITFPLLDLEDIQQVSIYDVWGGFTQNLVAASRRYGTDVVYSARLYFVEDKPVEPMEGDSESDQLSAFDSMSDESEPVTGWVADWSMINGDNLLTGRLQGDGPEALNQSLIQNLADLLADSYAIASNAGLQRMQLTVTNIDNLEKYEDVRTFLASLSVVANVSHVGQQTSFATFELELLGTESDLRNAIRLDDKITAEKDDFGVPVEGHLYIWKP